MKYSPIAVLAVLIVAILAMSRYAETRKDHHKENTCHAEGAAVTPDKAGERAKETNEGKDSPDWIDTFAWPDGVTVWALLLTLFVIAWQSAETRDAAQGALLNAQAVIDAERAWMIPEITQPPDYKAIIHPSEKDDECEIRITLTVKNYGKTPAIATKALFGFSSERILDPRAESWVLKLPQNLSYKYMHGGVVVEQAPGSIYIPTKGPNLHLHIDRKFLLKESPAWLRKDKCLCVRGWYEYKDIFERIRTTRFCYAYQDVSQIEPSDAESPNFPFRFRKCGPAIYNELTR